MQHLPENQASHTKLWALAVLSLERRGWGGREGQQVGAARFYPLACVQSETLTNYKAVKQMRWNSRLRLQGRTPVNQTSVKLQAGDSWWPRGMRETSSVHIQPISGSLGRTDM